MRIRILILTQTHPKIKSRRVYGALITPDGQPGLVVRARVLCVALIWDLLFMTFPFLATYSLSRPIQIMLSHLSFWVFFVFNHHYESTRPRTSQNCRLLLKTPGCRHARNVKHTHIAKISDPKRKADIC